MAGPPRKATVTPKVSFAPGQPQTVVVDSGVDNASGEGGRQPSEREEVEQLLGLLRALVSAADGGPTEGGDSAEPPKAETAVTLSDLKSLLAELLLHHPGSSGGTAGAPSSRGILMKERQDAEYKDSPESIFQRYRDRIKERLKIRTGEAWRPRDLIARGLLNFRGYRTLHRWFILGEEMMELLAKAMWLTARVS